MINILLADDHKMFREGIKQILSFYSDIKIAGEAGNAVEALEITAREKFGVLILDISMPGMNIFDLLDELKRINNQAPVLILSMHPEEQYALRLLKAGVSGYLTKESAAEELVSAIRKVYSGGKYISSRLAETLADSLSSDTKTEPHKDLSNREFEVMCMIASGKNLKEISASLFISPKTVTTYRARILAKLNLKNNIELTKYVLDKNLLN